MHIYIYIYICIYTYYVYYSYDKDIAVASPDQQTPAGLRRLAAQEMRETTGDFVNLSLRGSKGVPRKGVGTSVNMRVRTCEESRAKCGQTTCYLRPPFLGTPSVLS